jgi:hypothetical protein
MKKTPFISLSTHWSLLLVMNAHILKSSRFHVGEEYLLQLHTSSWAYACPGCEPFGYYFKEVYARWEIRGLTRSKRLYLVAPFIV